MLRNDEIIALNSLMFAERWRLQPWLDIRWDEGTQKYSTFLLHSTYNSVEDESECEISSLDDLNLLLATDAEFYRNVTTLTSIGALEPYDVEVEFLIQVIFDRIKREEPKTSYGYSMVTGTFVPSGNHIYEFDDKEAETGQVALEAIKIFSRTGDWWGETLSISHVDKEWCNRTHDYVPSDDRAFRVQVCAENVYRFACRESVDVTAENILILSEAVDDVMFNSGSDLPAKFNKTQNFWASCLFCERSDEVNDEFSPQVLNNMPVEIAALFPSFEKYQVA